MHGEVRPELVALFRSNLSAEEVNKILANLGVVLHQEEHKYVAEQLKLVRTGRSTSPTRGLPFGRLPSPRSRSPSFNPTDRYPTRDQSPGRVQSSSRGRSPSYRDSPPMSQSIERAGKIPSSRSAVPIRSVNGPTQRGSVNGTPYPSSESASGTYVSRIPTSYSAPSTESPIVTQQLLSSRALSPLRNRSSNYTSYSQ